MSRCMCRLLHRKRRAPERALLTGMGSILCRSYWACPYLFLRTSSEEGAFSWMRSQKDSLNQGHLVQPAVEVPAAPCRMCNRRCPGHLGPAILGCSVRSACCETYPHLGPGQHHCRCVNADADTSQTSFLLVCRIHPFLQTEELCVSLFQSLVSGQALLERLTTW